ncbi:MAG: FIST C-terminal domain-containing protein [Deltaproteobacteria bacterium]|nr:FIST C-terminal domain-containing protein [Deltaproteobacteria bacterium]MBW2393744.1 FIST C-terminal domain-containing protein [Deltaproteobacteria bacterium]
MHWASAVSQFPDADRAAGEACDLLTEKMRGAPPSLIVAFASAHHADSMLSIGEQVRRSFPDALLFGCSAHSVIGAGREIEEGPGIALTGAHLPGVELHPFHVPAGRLPELPVPDETDFLLLGDAFSPELEGILTQLDESFPERTKVGGLASGAQQPGENLLYLGDETLRAGLVGVAIHGNIALDTIVAQGCRPVGHPLFVTRAEGNVIHEVDGMPPIEVLNELFEQAEDARERALFQSSMFLGLAMRPAEDQYGQGDYLIRNLLGADDETGALHVAAQIEPRQVVQFHLRDAHTADNDLDGHLERYQQLGAKPGGALLFSCLGRGQGLYGVPDHDSDALREALGELPIGGFFCNGEIGPVGGRTFLHGYTSAFALFRSMAN